MNFGEMTAAKVLVARYCLEARLESPGSVTGHQVEQARLGLATRPADGGRVNTQEMLRSKYADLVLLCQGLTAAEEAVCRCRYGNIAGTLVYEEVRRLCDLVEGDGEEVIDVRPRDPEGSPMDGYVRVRGRQGRFPTHVEIAEQLGLTCRQVRSRLDEARAKVTEAIRWRAFATALEDRYE